MEAQEWSGRRRSPLRPGAVTSIGSLPHRDADEAAAFVRHLHPGLPAAPQLPLRSAAEEMIAQGVRGISGVELTPSGTLVVDADRLDPSAPVDASLDGAGHAGLLAFLALLAGRTQPVKLQLTGPVTLGRALTMAGAEPGVAYAVAGAAVRARARALVELCRRRLPDAPLLVFLDEPALVGLADLDLDAEQTIDLLSSALAVLEVDAVTGVHCCGSTDWRLVTAAGPTVISLPATSDAMGPEQSVLAGHLEQGGWIAWGAVPTSEPVGTDAERLWRHLGRVWDEAAAAGCDPVALRTQALVTPACGLAGHGVSQAHRALRLAAALGERLAQCATPLSA